MKSQSRSFFTASSIVCGLLLFGIAATPGQAAPSAAATAGFNSYIGMVEGRLGQQHRSPRGFLSTAGLGPQGEERLRRGELIVERMTPTAGASLPGALLHHWRGTAFAPGAKAADFERLMRDFNAYPEHYAPQVVQAKQIGGDHDRVWAQMRVRQRHVITVVMDTSYEINFGRLDPQRGYSLSRSTRIAEIAAPGTASERALAPSQEHGFLWRLNTYWSYEERDGGLYMQIESVSLTRSIPMGLGWAVRPFVESVPRESLEFTLRSSCQALRR